MDTEAIAAHVDAVLNDPLYWFPVRHHSPTVARHLAAAIRERRPKIIFIEGPFEATDLIPHIVDANTVPPVAIYTSYRDDDNVLGLNGIASPAADIPARFAAWYPLTAYSPEFVAMRLAATIGATVQFIDLPHGGGSAHPGAGRTERRSTDRHQRILPGTCRGGGIQNLGRGLGQPVREPAHRRPRSIPARAG